MDSNIKPSCNDKADPNQEAAADKLRADSHNDSHARHAPHAPSHKDHFRGLNLGFIKIGIDDRGSFAVGVNVGVAHVDARVGRINGVDAGAGLGPVGVNTDDGFGFYKDGIHSHVKVGAGATEYLGGQVKVNAQLGPKTGVDSSVGAAVGPFHTRHSFNSFVGTDGFNTGYEGNTGIANALQAGGRANLGLNNDSAVGAQVGVRAGNASLGTGAEITTDGNRAIRPEVQTLRARVDDDETIVDGGFQFGPNFDAKVVGGVHHQNYADDAPYERNW
jgi:hypothetical protein